jgi:hypothetical protein
MCEDHFERLAAIARREHPTPQVDLRGIDPSRYMGRVFRGLLTPGWSSAYEPTAPGTDRPRASRFR